MHDFLFKDIRATEGSKIEDYARDLGLDLDRFRDAINSGRAKQVVDGDIAIGQRFGVSGTPAFFINGRFLSGAQPLSTFETLCDQELKRAEGLLQKGVKSANLYDELIAKGEQSI
jgi:protein-disulfide isomerase